MTNDVKTEPCLKGLTPACFRAHPDYAKRVFAYRLMLVLLPSFALKRLPKLKAILLKIPLPVIPGVLALPDDISVSVTPAGVVVVSEITFPEPIPTPVEPTPTPVEPTPTPVEPTPTPTPEPVVPPIYIPPWEPGPIITSQPTQEEDAVPAILKAKIDISTAADIEVIAAVATRKISISSIVFTVAGETNITLKSGATAISGAMDFGGTNEPMGMSHGMGDMPLQTAAGEAFVIANSIAVQVSGWVTYFLS